MNEISFESIRSFCKLREVDLVFTAAPSPFQVMLKGEFDGHGWFFSILARDLEYIELPAVFTVGDLILTQVSDATKMVEKWRLLGREFSGPAIVMRSADADSFEAMDPIDLYVVVANAFVFRAGPDWSEPGK